MSGRPPGTEWRAADGLHIDTRGLGPPGPMVAILARLERDNEGGPLIVHLDRDPVYLYPELSARGWVARPLPAEAGETRLMLTVRG